MASISTTGIMYSNVSGDAVDADKITVSDLENKKGELQVAERPVCCPSAFNKLYYYLDSILDKFFWRDAALSTSDRPIFTKAERYNIFFYILGIMCYKVRTLFSKCRPRYLTPAAHLTHS